MRHLARARRRRPRLKPEWKRPREIVQTLARAGGNNQRCGKGNLGPAHATGAGWQRNPRPSAKETAACRKASPQRTQSVQSVIRSALRSWARRPGKSQSRVPRDGQLRHRQSVGKRRGGTCGLSGCAPTGANRTRSSWSASRAARAIAKWPRCGGSKLPPKNATRPPATSQCASLHRTWPVGSSIYRKVRSTGRSGYNRNVNALPRLHCLALAGLVVSCWPCRSTTRPRPSPARSTRSGIAASSTTAPTPKSPRCRWRPLGSRATC